MLATSVETLPFAHLLSSSKSSSDLVQQFDDNDGQDGSGDGDMRRAGQLWRGWGVVCEAKDWDSPTL